jgi:hypothetical protein
MVVAAVCSTAEERVQRETGAQNNLRQWWHSEQRRETGRQPLTETGNSQTAGFAPSTSQTFANAESCAKGDSHTSSQSSALNSS